MDRPELAPAGALDRPAEGVGAGDRLAAAVLAQPDGHRGVRRRRPHPGVGVVAAVELGEGHVGDGDADRPAVRGAGRDPQRVAALPGLGGLGQAGPPERLPAQRAVLEAGVGEQVLRPVVGCLAEGGGDGPGGRRRGRRAAGRRLVRGPLGLVRRGHPGDRGHQQHGGSAGAGPQPPGAPRR